MRKNQPVTQIGMFGSQEPMQTGLGFAMPPAAHHKVPSPENTTSFCNAYHQAKRENTDKLVFINHNFFYIAYDEDALRVSSILKLPTLRADNKFYKKLCIHADHLNDTIKKLRSANFGVAIINT